MWQRKLSALVACSALVAGLGACGGDPEPKFTKAPSASTSATASVKTSPTPSDPTPPKMPAAAKKHTIAGAKAFTRFFMATVDYSGLALDPSALRALSSSYCSGCDDAIKGIERLARRNAKVVGGRWSQKTMSVTPLRAGSKRLMKVTTTGRFSRQVVTYPTGAKDVYKASPTNDRLILLPTRDGWTVDTWEVL